MADTTMNQTTTLKATCLCGRAAHEITLPSTALPLPGYFCHCTSCRNMTGALALTTAFLPPSYEPSPSLLEKLTPFAFSPRITQYFCPTCGAQMLAHSKPKASNPPKEANWDVMTGTLEQYDGIVDLKGHEYVHDTLDGGFSDFLPSLNNSPIQRWPHDIDEGAQLPLYWRCPPPHHSTPTETKPDPSARLQAHCKCTAITFHIARPSLQSTTANRPWPDLLVPYYAQYSGASKTNAANETWWLRANKTKYLAGLCACDSCRLASGMEFTAWAFVPKIDVSLDAAGERPLGEDLASSFGEGVLRRYESSEGVERFFCGGCGAVVFYADGERDGARLLDVAVGLLGAGEGARAEGWLEWRTERLSFREDGVGRAGGLVEGVEGGLGEFRERGFGRRGQAEEVRRFLDE